MRIIDADVALEIADIELFLDETETVRFVLGQPPTVDAVLVCRCKDCEYYHDFETHYDCVNGYGIDFPRPDDFCSYGNPKK